MRKPSFLVFTALVGLTSFRGEAAETPTRLLQQKLGIPSFIASVTDGELPKGSGLPEFILLQDIHSHAEVQHQIAALLLHGRRQWGSESIFIEGAFAKPKDLGKGPAPGPGALTNEVKAGRLTGTQMAAAMVPHEPLQLEPLEDRDLYLANLRAYERTGRWREGALRELKTLRLVKASFDFASRSLSSEQLDRLELLVRLKMKPVEYEALKNDALSLREGSALAEAVDSAKAFYDFADRRSLAFVERAKQSDASGPKVLVVGGFHTALMADALRREGRSFAVLTPKVTRSGFDQVYAQRMDEAISALNLSQP